MYTIHTRKMFSSVCTIVYMWTNIKCIMKLTLKMVLTIYTQSYVILFHSLHINGIHACFSYQLQVHMFSRYIHIHISKSFEVYTYYYAACLIYLYCFIQIAIDRNHIREIYMFIAQFYYV